MTREDRNRRLARAGALKAAGVVIASLCGLCTATCTGPAIVDIVRGEPDYMAQFVVLVGAVLGGLPIAIGLILVAVGSRMEREAKSRPPPETFN